VGSVLEVVGARAGDAPLTYTLTELGTVDLQTVFAHFNGAGASGSFRPCLTLRAQNGAILGRLFPTEELSAGDSADVTYSPFFRRSTAPAGLGYPAVVALLATSKNLRGYWRLGDGGFGPYADSSGRPLLVPMDRVVSTTHLTDLASGALTVDDDGAIQFNSSNGLLSDYLDAPNVWGLGVDNPFDYAMGTIAGWVKPIASASTFKGGMFSMLSITGSGDQGYVVGVSWPALTVFHQRNAVVVTGPALTANQWSFVCGVWDGVATTIYVNGALVATGASDFGIPNTNIDPKIGRWNHSAQGVFYGGVDEVTVWGDALSSDEIATLYASAG
jgi:hypothetical protein